MWNKFNITIFVEKKEKREIQLVEQTICDHKFEYEIVNLYYNCKINIKNKAIVICVNKTKKKMLSNTN